MFDLCAGFVYSQTLLACVQLRLFEILAKDPQTAADLAATLQLTVSATTRLLDAAVSLNLAERRSAGRYGLGALGCAMLGNPGVTAMIEHHTALYADLADPVALLRNGPPGALVGYWPYADAADPASLSAEQTDRYTTLMAASQAFIAEEILAAYDFSRHRGLLDVGGGDGTFLALVAACAPSLRLQLFDLPVVAARARTLFAARRLNQAVAIGGDAIRGPLPAGSDIISFVRVLHDHDDDDALAMLRHAYAALPPGGSVLVAEPMSGTNGAAPIGDAYFGFYFLAMGQGRSRTSQALAALLADASFLKIRHLPTRMPILARILVATKA